MEMVNTFALHAGWLIDGKGGPIRQNTFLDISEGTILSIDQASPGHPKVLDFSNCTILPGIVDSHAHLSMSGGNHPEIKKNTRDSLWESRKTIITRNIRDHLANGVLAVRDGGDRAGHVSKFKKNGLSLDPIPVHLHSPGKAWHAPGRYGAFIGRTPLSGHTLAQSIREEKNKGDHIKIVNSGLNSLTNFAEETPRQFDRDQIEAAVQAGHDLGLRSMVHANGQEAVRVALEAGCDSIEHGYFMGTDNLRRMAETGITWVPTVFTMEAYTRILAPDSRESEIAGKNRDHQLQQIQTAAECGVKMAVGTDAGSPGVFHGSAMREEMALFVRAGLPLEKTVQCATSNGASLMGLDDMSGTLLPGRPATFLVFRGPPEALLNPLNMPKRIFISGRMVAESN